MTGEYNEHGKLCARVMIGSNTLLVDRKPVQLLDETLKYIGFDLRGAIKGAKEILGNRKMCPFVMNPYQGVCLFPNKSPRKEDCIWFNPDHIVDCRARGTKTVVELSNGISMIVDTKFHTLNNKIQLALKLKRISSERGKLTTPLSLFTATKIKELRFNATTGKYNFGSLEHKG